MKTAFNIKKKNLSGLTTVELIVAATIMAVVLIVAAEVLISNIKLFNRGSSFIELTSTNKIALDEIVNQIRQSQSVVNSCTQCGTDTTGTNTLILRLWPTGSGADPLGNGNYDYIVYKIDPNDNTKIRKLIYPDASSQRNSSDKIIGTNTSNLEFTYANADPALSSSVKVKIKNTTIVNGASQEIEREAKAVLRNK